jgi:hypothetical protein
VATQALRPRIRKSPRGVLSFPIIAAELNNAGIAVNRRKSRAVTTGVETDTSLTITRQPPDTSVYRDLYTNTYSG